MPCYSPLKGWARYTGGITFNAKESNGNRMEVACGQCLGCRLDHARMWSIRISHEASLYQFDRGSCFITLTYADEHLLSWSLFKRHFQLFMKKLRKYENRRAPKTWGDDDPGDGVRFFMCGEYGIICRHKLATEPNDRDIPLCLDGNGCKVGRPHFHAILFNMHFPEMEPIGRGQDDIIYYTDHHRWDHLGKGGLHECWGMGNVTIGECNMTTAGYVARYAVKKITGDAAKDHYVNIDDYGELISVEPEFCTMSNRPGIGKSWFDKYSSDVFPSDEVPVPGQGVYKKVPRYYQDIMNKSDEEIIREVKDRRLQYLLENKHEFSPGRIKAKYKVKKAQIKNLKRNQL